MDTAQILVLVGPLLIVYFLFILPIAFVSAWVAAKKGYSRLAWFGLGLLLGVLALLALAIVPRKAMRVEPPSGNWSGDTPLHVLRFA